MTPRRKIIFGVVSMAMFSLLLVVIFGDNGLVELKRLQHTHQSLVQHNARLTQDNSLMYATVDRLQNDAVYIDNIARRELGMIRSDELIFKFKSDPKAQ